MNESATYRELRRSRSDRMLAGVCGGLGRYFNVNPVFYRVAFVVLTLIGGAGILIYGACLLVIPAEGDADSIASDALRNHRQRPVALVGLALVGVAGIALLSHISFRIHSDGFWIAVLVGGALILGAQRHEHHPRAAAPAPATTATTTTTVVSPPARPRRSRFKLMLLVLGLAFLIVLGTIAGFAISYLHIGDGFGDRSWAPQSTTALHDYRLGAGRLRVNLSKLTVTKPTTVDAHLGMGKLEVIVPRGVAVQVNGHATWGSIDVLGHEDNGHDVNDAIGSSTPQLTIDAHVDVGRIEVTRAVR
jgi:phage shock protein PspC (stress-responsive transcriptional regulator)